MPAPRDDWQWMLCLSIALLALRVLYIVDFSPYGLSPDEAQYWTWLAHNDLSFLTKPPLTTWLMGISTAFLGDTKLGVKAFALLGQAALAGLGFALAREVGGRRAGWWAWALLVTVPLASAGGLIMSPDAILVPLWLGALLPVVRALRPSVSEKRALSWQRWLLVGALVGVAGLAKYSAVFFYPLLGVFMLVWRREWLLKPQVWASGLVALALQLPVIVWNLQHHFVGGAHVLWQADGGGDTRHGGLRSLGEFFGSQALVLGPLVFGLLLAAWWVEARRAARPTHGKAAVKPAEALLLTFSLPVFVGFTLLTLHGKVQANWPVLATLPALILLAVWLARQQARRWVMGLAAAGIVLNTGLSVVLLNTHEFHEWGLFPIPHKNDPTKDLRGWPQMGMVLAPALAKLDRPLILSSRYQTLAPLAFHTAPGLRGGLEVAYINAEGRRLNQYDLWPKPDLRDRLVVYVNEMGVVPDGIKTLFKACEPWRKFAVEDFGTETRKLTAWICWGAK